MPIPLTELISPEKGLIFRITHRDNISYLLKHGVHCRNSMKLDPSFVQIGHPGIITQRQNRVVDASPGGTLADYVPFYFSPRTPMLYNIVTGRNGVELRMRAEIVVLVTSIDRLEEHGRNFVIADRSATLVPAIFTAGRDAIATLRWDLWQRSDFQRDPDDPAKIDQYHAEALIYKSLPATALLAIITYDTGTQAIAKQAVSSADQLTPVHVRSIWYP